MATLQSKLNRPRAQAKAGAMAVLVRRPWLGRPLLDRGLAFRFLMVLATLLALFLLGHAATRATESLAIGIIAADLVFLVVIAAWSSVAASGRR